RILRKAGFFPALSLLLIVPLLGGLCVIVLLAFAPWPALKRMTHAQIASTFEETPMEPSLTAQAAAQLLPTIGIIFLLWMIARILHKAGYSGWWTLLMLIPIVNVVMIWVFAFSDWPALRARR